MAFNSGAVTGELIALVGHRDLLDNMQIVSSKASPIQKEWAVEVCCMT
jgi:hypothetical protein